MERLETNILHPYYTSQYSRGGSRILKRMWGLDMDRGRGWGGGWGGGEGGTRLSPSYGKRCKLPPYPSHQADSFRIAGKLYGRRRIKV